MWPVVLVLGAVASQALTITVWRSRGPGAWTAGSVMLIQYGYIAWYAVLLVLGIVGLVGLARARKRGITPAAAERWVRRGRWLLLGYAVVVVCWPLLLLV